jgi:hypothetical protein
LLEISTLAKSPLALPSSSPFLFGCKDIAFPMKRRNGVGFLVH